MTQNLINSYELIFFTFIIFFYDKKLLESVKFPQMVLNKNVLYVIIHENQVEKIDRLHTNYSVSEGRAGASMSMNESGPFIKLTAGTY